MGSFMVQSNYRGFRTAVNDDGVMNYGGNRCESKDGTLDDGVLRAEAGQDGAVTMIISIQLKINRIQCLKLQHTLGELQIIILMQKNIQWRVRKSYN